MRELVSTFGKELSLKFPKDSMQIADDLYSLRSYSKDLWPRGLISAREEGLPEPGIHLVVWPSDVHVLSEFVKTAQENNWELYPYGAGSGVCGGATPNTAIRDRKRIVVDLKKMDRIESIDPISQVAKIQAGMMGQSLEEDLNAQGYTMGHFPSSIYCSSFGGYLATRAAGQLSTYYGKIEDMVLSIEGVLPSGEIFRTPEAPRMSVGPDWNQFLLGSEGVFAFMTAAWVKVHRMAKAREFISFEVSSTESALEGVRKWVQAGIRPAVVRIYDEDESRMLMGIKNGVKLVCIVEGDPQLAEFSAEYIRNITKSWEGWTFTGEEPAQNWWSHRYDVSYRQQQIMSHRQMILDTFEVSTTWSKLPGLHKAVKRVTDQFKKQGMLVILAHFSHFYHTGGNIYFTLCGKSPSEKPTTQFYDDVWDALLKAAEEAGAAISHHHGIGRLKAKAFQRQRDVFHPLLKKLKHEFDPNNIVNPENLGL